MSTPHPHDAVEPVPDRLAADELLALSQLSPARALGAIAVEWSILAAAISVAVAADAWPVTVIAILVIGARQHALTVISHDATHFRLLPRRAWNDWVANLFLAWPMFISVQGFRHFHGRHHRHLGEEGDGNRALWHTHDAEGRLTSGVALPEDPAAGRAQAAAPRRGADRAVLDRARSGRRLHVRRVPGRARRAGAPVDGRLRGAESVRALARVRDLLGPALLHVARRRAVHSPRVRALRRPLRRPALRPNENHRPGPLARFFVLPRNIGYHLEHHWYPSVPFYRLPALHARLAGRSEFRAHAQCTRSVLASLRQCVTNPGPVKDLTLVTISGAGHFVQQDASELVTKTMKSWLTR